MDDFSSNPQADAALSRLQPFARLDGIDLTHRTLHDRNLYWARLRFGQLQEMRFERCTLSRASLDGSDLSGTALVGVVARRTMFRKTNMQSVKCRGLIASYSDFSDSDLISAALFDRVNLRHTRFDRSALINARVGNAPKASFIDVFATGCKFMYADYTGTDFRGGEFIGADFTGSLMHGARLDSANLTDAVIDPFQLARTRGWERAILDPMTRALTEIVARQIPELRRTTISPLH